MSTFINRLVVEQARTSDPRERVVVVLSRAETPDVTNVQQNIRDDGEVISFDVDSNGLEIMGYDMIERAAELLEKRGTASADSRAAKMRAFLKDVQST